MDFDILATKHALITPENFIQNSFLTVLFPISLFSQSSVAWYVSADVSTVCQITNCLRYLLKREPVKDSKTSILVTEKGGVVYVE